jgi:hypothetical protein
LSQNVVEPVKRNPSMSAAGARVAPP